MVSNLQKLSVLMKKNWMLSLRHWCQFTSEIIIPPLFFFLLLVLRMYREPDEPVKGRFIIQDPCERVDTITYSPKSPLLQNILQHKCLSMKGNRDEKQTKVQGYQTADESNAAFTKKNMEYKDLLIQFSDKCAGATTVDQLPKNLEVTIKEFCDSEFPIHCRRPDMIYVPDYLERPYRPLDQTEFGNDIRVIGILQAITTSILKQSGNKSDALNASFAVYDFPPPLGLTEEAFYSIHSLMHYTNRLLIATSVIIDAFLIYITIILKNVVGEKEKQLKESLEIMGLPGWLHWVSWFLFHLIFMTVGIIFLIIFLKSEIERKPIFIYADASLLFVFFEIYACSCITMAFFIGVFFSKAIKAVVLGSFIYLLTIAPFIVIILYTVLSKTVAIFASFLPNCAMGYGLLVVMQFEYTKKGVQWSNLFQSGSKRLGLSLGELILLLIFDTVLYMLLTLYVEAVFPAEFGPRQPWYFVCSPSFWRSRPEEKEAETTTSATNVNIEQFTEPLPIGIQIKNLSKRFGSNHAVKNLNLEIYEGHITVLIGHNGAGKTTTMSMIVGMFPPSSGTVFVNGYDVRKNIYKVRDSMGLCLQHNVLYDELTVAEHLYLFIKMKKIETKEIKKEVDMYIKLLDLESKRKAQSKTLSGGTKRKLSVGIALCGGSRVVLLDEPTSGVDPSARREIWDILQKQKKGRTILLTTHFMDEADVLGDRIAIIAGGELQCCGSSFYLKHQFGTGYYLIMDVDPKCQPDKITALLRKYVPLIKMHSYVGSELTYQIPQKEASKFEDMLFEIENNMRQLGILSYGVSLATLEEVFLKASIIYDKKRESKPATGSASRQIKYLKGCPRILNQFAAMVLKRVLCLIRKWWLIICFILVPLLPLFCFIKIDETATSTKLPPLKLNLDLYENPLTVMTTTQKSTLSEMYIKAVGTHELLVFNSLQDAGNTLHKDASKLDRLFIAASFPGVVAWYSTIPLHASLVSASIMLDAIYKTQFGEDYSISFTYQSISYSTEQLREYQGEDIMRIIVALIVMILSTIIVTCLFIIFYIQECVSGFKHLQYVAGVNIFIFWIASYLWDLIIFLTTVLIFAIIFRTTVMYTQVHDILDELISVFICFIIFYLPSIYLFSLIVKFPATGVRMLITLGFLSLVLLFVVFFVMALGYSEAASFINWIFLFCPYYVLLYGMLSFISYKVTEDDTVFNRSKVTIIGTVMGILLFILLLLIEYGVLRSLTYIICGKMRSRPQDISLEADVEKERNFVKNTDLKVLVKNHKVVLRDLTKYYGKPVVKNLCLVVKPYECFGLLGPNGAGKTTTLKMVTGEISISYGDIWVQELSIKTNRRSVETLIGYCPQFDALLEELTVRETLHIFALIRGIPNNQIRSIVEEYSESLDIFKYLDKIVKTLSGGNKRKLNTAIALMGDPPVLYLDEPTTGMDPIAKRVFWNLIIKLRDSGKTIILTSHSMEECEVLCTRVGIMIDGNLKCLGSTQRLKNKFAQGYNLTIKIKKETDMDNKIATVNSFVKKNFPGSTLKEQHESELYYELVNLTMPLSKAFSLIENNKKKVFIEDYSLGQCRLEQVFLNFARERK